MATKIGNIRGLKGAQGPTGPTGPTTLSTNAGNIASLGSDSLLYVPTTALPLASASVNGLVSPLSNKTTDYLDGTNTFNDLVTNLRPIIYSSRLRAYNAIGNPNFEVDQRQCGTSNIAGFGGDGSKPSSLFACDRHQLMVAGSGSTQFSAQQQSENVFLPGTNFCVGSKFMRYTVALGGGPASGQYYANIQYVEGPSLRPLLGDVHSISALIRSSVSGFNFGITLTDSTTNYCLPIRFTTGTANTWTLYQAPNLPVWTAGATWNTSPGNLGYQFYVLLGAGPNYTASSNNVWNSTNKLAPTGLGNFGGAGVGATFDIAFLQHEPGPDCSLPIDIAFPDNLRACLRYFCKNINYNQVVPVVNSTYNYVGQYVSGTTIRARICFPVEMAKTPVISMYGYAGVGNQIYIDPAGDVALTGSGAMTGINTTGFQGVNLNATPATAWAGAVALGQWRADTGW